MAAKDKRYNLRTMYPTPGNVNLLTKKEIERRLKSYYQPKLSTSFRNIAV